MQRYYFLLENMYRAMIIFRLTCLVGYPRTSAPEPDYVLTKPIHDSQKKVNESKVSSLRELYPSLDNGVFLQIDCRDNYELIRELASFGKDLIVLSPSVIQDKVWNRVSSMNEEYLKIRNSK